LVFFAIAIMVLIDGKEVITEEERRLKQDRERTNHIWSPALFSVSRNFFKSSQSWRDLTFQYLVLSRSISIYFFCFRDLVFFAIAIMVLIDGKEVITEEESFQLAGTSSKARKVGEILPSNTWFSRGLALSAFLQGLG
jgi:hypothetical protein